MMARFDGARRRDFRESPQDNKRKKDAVPELELIQGGKDREDVFSKQEEAEASSERYERKKPDAERSIESLRQEMEQLIQDQKESDEAWGRVLGRKIDAIYNKIYEREQLAESDKERKRLEAIEKREKEEKERQQSEKLFDKKFGLNTGPARTYSVPASLAKEEKKIETLKKELAKFPRWKFWKRQDRKITLMRLNAQETKLKKLKKGLQGPEDGFVSRPGESEELTNKRRKLFNLTKRRRETPAGYARDRIQEQITDVYNEIEDLTDK